MILTFRILQKRSGLKQAAAIRRWLKRQGVHCMDDGKGKPMTTLDAFNRALQSPRRGPDWSKPCSYPRKSTRNTAATTTSTGTAGTR